MARAVVADEHRVRGIRKVIVWDIIERGFLVYEAAEVERRLEKNGSSFVLRDAIFKFIIFDDGDLTGIAFNGVVLVSSCVEGLERPGWMVCP